MNQEISVDRSIGDIIRDARNLSADEVEQVLSFQRQKGVRFGEAAIALGLASEDEVLSALAQQFHYPLAAADKRNDNPELVTLNQPFSAQAEAFRAIRSQVTMRMSPHQGGRKALAVISAGSGDGKTYFAANLAVSLAQLGGRTLLVDADLRNARQHQVFGLGNGVGLSSILSGRAESHVIQSVEGVPSLYVLACGPLPPNPAELVERPAFARLMDQLIAQFDHVIVDTPAAEVGPDYAVISARCGAALALARCHKSRLDALEDLCASLVPTAAAFAGVVLNEY